jgi:hypothetical protein
MGAETWPHDSSCLLCATRAPSGILVCFEYGDLIRVSCRARELEATTTEASP